MFGQRVGGAVTTIEPRGMAALAEPEKRHPAEFGENPIVSNDLNRSSPDQVVEFLARDRTIERVLFACMPGKVLDAYRAAYADLGPVPRDD